MGDEGHRCLGEATNSKEADSLIRDISDGKIGPVDVAILDNDLEGNETPDPKAAQRAALLTSVGVVVFSTSGSFPIEVDGCTHIGKNVEKILKEINKL